ncbi:WD repeat-containing protein 7 [Homalodisca vitripennis]|nr:WD repeat-containing protein 7 [Homalodisca vitripennis]
MSAGTNLVVPVVLWGKTAPTHCISCVFLSKDHRTLVTGCHDGQICLWQVEPDTLKMTPRCLLVGHTAPILCLAKASIIMDNNYIVSSSESGEMCTWDLVDGKCREVVKLPYVHTNMQAYLMNSNEDVKLFCNGYYAEILVMDPFSLEVIFSLSSKVNPDWISALHVLRPVKRKDDVVLALTTTGTVKVWTLNGSETKYSEPLFEDESKQIKCLNAITLTCCSQNQRTVLIVCSKYWQIMSLGEFLFHKRPLKCLMHALCLTFTLQQGEGSALCLTLTTCSSVLRLLHSHNQTYLCCDDLHIRIYDAGDFSVLCSVISPRGERWLGGQFLTPDRVLVWTDEGKAYMYRLPANPALTPLLKAGCVITLKKLKTVVCHIFEYSQHLEISILAEVRLYKKSYKEKYQKRHLVRGYSIDFSDRGGSAFVEHYLIMQISGFGEECSYCLMRCTIECTTIFKHGGVTELFQIPGFKSVNSLRFQTLHYEKAIKWFFSPNSVADNLEFHKQSDINDTPFLYCVLSASIEKTLSCPPAIFFMESQQHGKLLLRGDSEGSIMVWQVPEVTDTQLAQIKQGNTDKPTSMGPKMETSLTAAWANMKPPPVGILDQLLVLIREVFKVYLDFRSSDAEKTAGGGRKPVRAL